MLVRRLLTAVVVASCSTAPATPSQSEPTQKVRLTDATPKVMPLATTVAGDGDPLRVAPLVVALNAAWKPLIVSLMPLKTMSWGDAGIQLMGKADVPAVYCGSVGDFNIESARGTYCLAPNNKSAQGIYANILVSHGHLVNELKMAQGDKKIGVSLMVAYFYAFHLRQLLRLGGVIQGSWDGRSQTQWCLTGVSLRALGVLTLPSPVPTLASASPTPNLLPMGLTHVFGAAEVKEDHEGWVIDGFTNGSVNHCFG